MSKKRSLILGIAGVLLGGLMFAGFSLWRFFSPVSSALVDEQIETVWLVDRDRIPAENFFADGGAFVTRPSTAVDANENDAVDLDQTLVLPLLERLQKEAGTTWLVLPEKGNPNLAYALVAEQPDGFAKQRQIERIFREADGSFDGRILVLRGDRWLSFELLPAGTRLLSEE